MAMFMVGGGAPYGAAAQDDDQDYSPQVEYLKSATNDALMAARQDKRFSPTLVDAEISRRGGQSPFNKNVAAPFMSGLSKLGDATWGAYQRDIGNPAAAAMRGLPGAVSNFFTPQLPNDQTAADDTSYDPGGPYPDDSATMSQDAGLPNDEPAPVNVMPTMGPPGRRPVNPALAAAAQSAPPDDIAGDIPMDIPQGANEEVAAAAAGDAFAAPQPSDSDNLLSKIAGQYLQAPDEDKARRSALSRAFFTMAASKNPYFLGALGEGANAGLTDYDKSRKDELDRQLKGATLLSQVDTNKARAQSRVDDLQYKYKALASAAQDRSLAREDRVAAAKEANQTRLDIAKLTASNRTASNLITLDDGTLASLNGNKVVPVTDGDGNPVKGTAGKGTAGKTSVYQQKVNALTAVVGPEQAVLMASGQKPADRATIERIALQAERNAAQNEFSPEAAKAAGVAARQRIYDVFGTQAGGAGAPASAPAADTPRARVGGGRPDGVPGGAQFSPSKGKWYWQENGSWKSN